MALELYQRQEQVSLHHVGVDLNRVFGKLWVVDRSIVVPVNFHILPDFRPVSEQARLDALAGLPPSSAGTERFDPALGPFSHNSLRHSSWAQNLDFLRDIKSAQKEGVCLSQNWVTGWIDATVGDFEKPYPQLVTGITALSKSEQLMRSSRRVLNCLAHVLPLLVTMPRQTRLAFWRTLMSDIARIGAPSDTLWSSIQEGFDPLSSRAIWLRAVALVGVQAALPDLLQAELINKSLSQINTSIQADGVIEGGSIIGTLSAGADLCMLGRIPKIEPILNAVRNALSSLRLKEGGLVTFGANDGDYRRLLAAVLGPGPWKSSALLLGSGIGRISVGDITLWMRAPQATSAWGPLCEIDVAGDALLTNFGSSNSGVSLRGSATVTQARCRRRDEPDGVLLVADGTFGLMGHAYNYRRQIKLAHDGSCIQGEDVIKVERGHDETGIKEICFAISESSQCYLSADKLSVLIVTSQQQRWRFRIFGMDISVELGSITTQRHPPSTLRHMIICRRSNIQRQSDFRATWQLMLEDLE